MPRCFDEPRSTVNAAGSNQVSVGMAIEATVVALAAVAYLAHFTRGQQIKHDTINKKVVVAQSLAIRNADGRDLAMLWRTSAGQTALNFHDARGQVSLSLGTSAQGFPRLNLSGSASPNRMTLSVLPRGTKGMTISRAGSKAGLDVALFDGEPLIAISAGDGEPRVTLAGPEAGRERVRFVLSDERGTARVGLAHSDQLTHISLYDSENHARGILGLFPGRAPDLSLYDRRRLGGFKATLGVDSTAIIRLNDAVAGKSKTIK